MGQDDIYSKDYVADPVTEDAVAAAMAATDKEPSKFDKFIDRFFILILTFVVIVGTSGVVIGSIAIYNNSKNTQKIKNTQECFIKLYEQQQADAAVRAQIASDDREVSKKFNAAIVQAKTKADLQKAYNDFKDQTAINEEKRKSYAITVPDVDKCVLFPAVRVIEKPKIKSSPSSSKKPAKNPTPSRTPGVNPNPPVNGSQSNSPGSAASTAIVGGTKTITIARVVSRPSISGAPSVIVISPIIEPLPPVTVPVGGALCQITHLC